MVTLDICRPFLGNKSANDSRTLSRIGTASTAFLCLTCIPFGGVDLNLSNLISSQAAMLQALVPTYLFSMYWPKMKGWHAVTSILFGLTGGIIEFIGNYGVLQGPLGSNQIKSNIIIVLIIRQHQALHYH